MVTHKIISTVTAIIVVITLALNSTASLASAGGANTPHCPEMMVFAEFSGAHMQNSSHGDMLIDTQLKSHMSCGMYACFVTLPETFMNSDVHLMTSGKLSFVRVDLQASVWVESLHRPPNL